MNDFDVIAKIFIDKIVDQIEIQDISYQFDIDYFDQVLSINMGNQVFIINKQRPLQEIWLASPISGPYHFKNINNSWQDKEGNKIIDILSKELSAIQPQKIKISE